MTARDRKETAGSGFQAWLMVALLFLASIVSVIDRTILNVVVDAVKADLDISDVQISLLQGIAFGLFYATMGVWLGLVADRTARRNLIIGGIALWSFATVGGGLAQGFGSLFVARMLVGLGEAALSPAAISLIADLFPEGRRGRPIGIFLMGQALANGISISVTGALLGAASRGELSGLPLLGDLAPWRIVFILCGLVGLLVSAAFFMTREPKRESAPPSVSFVGQARNSVGYILRERRRFAGVYLGFAIYFLGAYGSSVWQVAMISRQHGTPAAEVAAIFGPIAIGFGLISPMIGGALVDRVVGRAGTPALLWLLAFAPLLALPSALAVLAPGVLSATVLCATQAGVSAIVGSAVLAYLQSAMPPEMRGFSVSLTGLLNTLLGSALGPTLVALISDNILGDPAKVGWAILWVAAPAQIVAALLFAVTAATVAPRPASLAKRMDGPAHG